MSTEITHHSGRYQQTAPQGAHREERGGSLIEYCLLVALISLVAVASLTFFGTARDDVFTRAASSIAGP